MRFQIILASLALATQAAALPVGSSDLALSLTPERSVDDSSLFSPLKTRIIDIFERDNTNPGKHETNAAKDKNNADKKEDKEQKEKANQAANLKNGKPDKAAKEGKQAEREEGKEGTAKAHEVAEKKKLQTAQNNPKGGKSPKTG